MKHDALAMGRHRHLLNLTCDMETLQHDGDKIFLLTSDKDIPKTFGNETARTENMVIS